MNQHRVPDVRKVCGHARRLFCATDATDGITEFAGQVSTYILELVSCCI